MLHTCTSLLHTQGCGSIRVHREQKIGEKLSFFNGRKKKDKWTKWFWNFKDSIRSNCFKTLDSTFYLFKFPVLRCYFPKMLKVSCMYSEVTF